MAKNETVPINDKVRKPTPKKEFSLSDYKKSTGFDKSAKLKPQRWLPIKNVLGNTSFMEATGLSNGIPLGECINIMGHTNTGKTLLINEIAYSCQKNNILPVFIITELKFSWEHLKLMGFEYEEVVDENTGEITYDGNFLYVDRSQFNTIEEMGVKMLQILEDQKSSKLPFDLMFIVDSIGTIPSEMSFTKNTSNNEWDAGAISRVLGKGLFWRINASKKETYPYYNTMVIITQVWVRKPEVYGQQPKLATKGGDTIPFNSTLQLQFGNVSNSGISLLKTKKNGKEIVYATRTKVSVTKNHITGISLSSKIIATPHGFISDSPDDKLAKQYFKENAEMFMKLLEVDTIDDVEFFEEEGSSSETGEFYGIEN